MSDKERLPAWINDDIHARHLLEMRDAWTHREVQVERWLQKKIGDLAIESIDEQSPAASVPLDLSPPRIRINLGCLRHFAGHANSAAYVSRLRMVNAGSLPQFFADESHQPNIVYPLKSRLFDPFDKDFANREREILLDAMSLVVMHEFAHLLAMHNHHALRPVISLVSDWRRASEAEADWLSGFLISEFLIDSESRHLLRSRGAEAGARFVRALHVLTFFWDSQPPSQAIRYHHVRNRARLVATGAMTGFENRLGKLEKDSYEAIQNEQIRLAGLTFSKGQYAYRNGFPQLNWLSEDVLNDLKNLNTITLPIVFLFDLALPARLERGLPSVFSYGPVRQ